MEQLMTLSKIFTEKLYRIPDYQRGYAWSKKEADDFWHDLNRLKQDKKYYVGVVTLERVKEKIYANWIDDLWIIKSKNYQPYYVVDGQQRLTTSVILIQCIIEEMLKQNIDTLNYDTRDDIVRKYISQSKPENLSKSHLFSYENGNPSLDFWTQEIFSSANDPSNTKDMTMYTFNLALIKDFFKEKLALLDKNALECVYAKLTQAFLFNIYEITDDIDVFVAFESMNNRGKRLSVLELLKNRLIYLSTLFNVEDDIKLRLRAEINKCWKILYSQLGLSPDNPLLDDEFLSSHYVLYFPDLYYDAHKGFRSGFKNYDSASFAKLRSTYLLDEYFIPEHVENNTLVPNDIFNYINSLSKSVKIWGQIKSPRSSNWGEDIQILLSKINYSNARNYGYVGEVSQITLLLNMLQSNSDISKIKRLLKNIERFNYIKLFYQYEVIGDQLREFDEDEIILKACKEKLNIDTIIEKYEKKCVEITGSSSIYRKLLKYYSKSNFYSNKTLVFYTLCDYELKLMKESKSTIQKVNNALLGDKNYATIEHVYPQKTAGSYWKTLYRSFSTKQKNKLKNSIGNFVLVSELKNGKLGNKSFVDKKENCDNVVGYKYGSYSEIEICKNTDWGHNEIMERGKKLLTFMNERWKLSLKKDDFPTILGLTFLKQ